MKVCSERCARRSPGRPSAVRRFLPTGADGFEVPTLFDGRPKQLGRVLRIGLGAALQLRGGAPDESAGRAIAAAIEASVAMRAVHLEGAMRLEETQDLGLGDEGPRID